MVRTARLQDKQGAVWPGEKVWRWFDVPLILLSAVLAAAAVLILTEGLNAQTDDPNLLALSIGAGFCAGVLLGALWRRVGLGRLGLRGAGARWWGTALLVAALWVPLRQLPTLLDGASFSWLALAHARPQDVVLGILAAVVLAPLGEELFYRGVLYRWLRQIVPLGIALGLSALLFTAVHWSGDLLHPSGLALVFGSGLLYAWLFERSGSLLPGLLVHVLVNLAGLLLLLGS